MLADVKHILLGHWGMTPGQNSIYAHREGVEKDSTEPSAEKQVEYQKGNELRLLLACHSRRS